MRWVLSIEWWLRRLHFVPHGLLISDSSEFTKSESFIINRRMYICGTMKGIISIALDIILRITMIYDDENDDNQSFIVTGRVLYLFKGINLCFLGLLWRPTYCSQLLIDFLQLGLNLTSFFLPHLKLSLRSFCLFPWILVSSANVGVPSLLVVPDSFVSGLLLLDQSLPCPL